MPSHDFGTQHFMSHMHSFVSLTNCRLCVEDDVDTAHGVRLTSAHWRSKDGPSSFDCVDHYFERSSSTTKGGTLYVALTSSDAALRVYSNRDEENRNRTTSNHHNGATRKDTTHRHERKHQEYSIVYVCSDSQLLHH